MSVLLLGMLDIKNNSNAKATLKSALRDKSPEVVHATLRTVKKFKFYSFIDEYILLTNAGNVDAGIAKEAILAFEATLDVPVPGSKYMTAANVTDIAASMRAYWANNKDKFMSSAE